MPGQAARGQPLPADEADAAQHQGADEQPPERERAW